MATNVTKEVIELSAIDNASKVLEGVGGAAKKLGDTYESLIGQMGKFGLAVAGLGSAGAFGAMIKSTIEGEAALLRLAERTGNTVEALSSLGRVAKMSNTDMDEVGKGMQKLAKSMAEAESGTGKAGKVFEALGISIRDANTGALRPTQVVMQELGQKLMAMQDQTLAVAFAQETLGKSGANLIPFLYELARAGELQAKVTTEQAKQAKEFEDNLVKLKGASMEFWRHLANDMLPTLNKYLDQLIAGKKIFGGWIGALAGAGFTNPFKSPGEQLDSIRGDLGPLLERQQGLRDRGDNGLANAMQGRIEALQKQKKWFEFLQRQEALEATAGMDTGDQVSRRFMGRGTKVDNPFAAAGENAKEATEDYRQLFAVYQMQLDAWKEGLAIQKEQAQLQHDLRKVQDDAAEAYAKALDRMRKGELGEEENLQTRVVGYQLWQAEIKKTDDLGRQLGLTLSSAAAAAIQHWQGFGNLLRGIALDIGQMVLKATVLKPMEDSVNSWVKDSGVGSWFSGLFGGGKAVGGPVDAGTTYLVGENGPELFTPPTAGNITPNHMLGGGGTVYIDARGADQGAVERIAAGLRKLDMTVERRSVAAWQRANNMRGIATVTG